MNKYKYFIIKETDPLTNFNRIWSVVPTLFEDINLAYGILDAYAGYRLILCDYRIEEFND